VEPVIAQLVAAALIGICAGSFGVVRWLLPERAAIQLSSGWPNLQTASWSWNGFGTIYNETASTAQSTFTTAST